MAENSKIEWTDHAVNSPVMGGIVAIITKRDPVINVKAQVWKVGKWLDVMRYKVAAATISALLTNKFVSRKHVKAPALILHRKALTATLNKLAVFVSMMVGTTNGRIARSLGSAHFLFSLFGMRYSEPGLLPFERLADLTLGFFRVLSAFERRYSASQGSIGIGYLAAGHTGGRQTIAAATVSVKVGTLLPRLALVAPFQTVVDLAMVLFQSYADTLCRHLRRADLAAHLILP